MAESADSTVGVESVETLHAARLRTRETVWVSVAGQTRRSTEEEPRLTRKAGVEGARLAADTGTKETVVG